MLQKLASAIDRIWAPDLGRVSQRLANLETIGDCKRFVVNRMGSTGSTWLAKLLNSHPDVFCSHEGVISRIYPAQNCSSDDILHFLEYFAWDNKHGAYCAIGDVGSVWAVHIAYLPFTTALLVRHPARLLETRLRTYPSNQSFTAVEPKAQTCLRELWGIDPGKEEPVDQVLLNDQVIFASQLWLIDKTNLIIRIEDMQERDYCRHTLKALTGLDYDRDLIERSIEKRENRRSGSDGCRISQIIGRFSARQRNWYEVILREVISYFGYELLADPPSKAA